MENPGFKSLEDIYDIFPDEPTCIAYLEKLRWNGFVESPFDSISKVYKCSNNRYRCRNTGKYFNVKTGTIFYNSKIELQKWFAGIWIASANEKSITSVDLAKELNITQKSAWYMLRRIKNYPGLETDAFRANKTTENIKIAKPTAPTLASTKESMQMLEWLQMLKKE